MGTMTCPMCAETIPAGGGWCPFCRSELSLEARPLKVDDTFAWAIVAVPLVMLLTPVAFPTVSVGLLTVGIVVLNVAFAVLDDRRVQAAGYDAVSVFWALVAVPIYLVVRGRRVSRCSHFLAWCMTFLAYLAVVSAASR